MSQAWIETFTGKRFDILEPRVEDVCIEDIAHSLSLQCRFTGHTKWAYSIAQHSYLASWLVPEEDELWALLHDASEAYISDLSRPLKHFTEAGKFYLEIEKKIQNTVCQRFDLPFTMPDSVHKADTAMLYAEKAALLLPMEWDTNWGDEPPAPVYISELTPGQAEALFLDRFHDLR